MAVRRSIPDLKAPLHLLKHEKPLRFGVKPKRWRAAWDEPYLLQVLCAS